MTDLEGKRRQERIVASDLAEVARFAGSLIVLVIGALMLAEGLVKSIAGTTMFFPEVSPSFEFVIDFVVIVLGGSLMSMNRSRLFVTTR